MNVTPETAHRPGQPRSEGDAAFLERFDARMRLPIIVSAILPLVVVPESGDWLGVVVGIVTWLVFLVDYVVQARHRERYGHTRLGRFDLFVVVATAPWFLLPGAHAGGFVVLLRLARLARLMLVSKGAHRLFDRLGRVAAVAGGVLVVGSLVAYYAEHPTNPEFATVGDALWWGVVTLTTVGYGDIVPQTPTGRWAAVMIMITGIAVLGLLAGALASFFRLDENHAGTGPPADMPASPAATASPAAMASAAATATDTALQALAAEVAALRRQVETLTHRLTGTPPDQASEEPPHGEDAIAAPLRGRIAVFSLPVCFAPSVMAFDSLPAGRYEPHGPPRATRRARDITGGYPGIGERLRPSVPRRCSYWRDPAGATGLAPRLGRRRCRSQRARTAPSHTT